MSVTITLPPGTTEVTVREIPGLFAEALHPKVLDGTEKIVTRLMRQTKNPSAIPAPRCEPLSPDDWGLLMAIWSHLPVYKDMMRETEWSKYAEAFESAQYLPDWQLVPLWSGTAHQCAMDRFITTDEHHAAIPRAVAAGELIVRSRSRVPIPDAIGERLESGIVLVDDFARYALGLGILVRVRSAHLTLPDMNAAKADSPPLVDSMTERVKAWDLATPERYQGYGKPLHDVLRKAQVAGLRCPSARDVLDAFKEVKPSEIAEIMATGMKYFDIKGNIKEADLRAIQKAIDRLLKKRPVSGRLAR